MDYGVLGGDGLARRIRIADVAVDYPYGDARSRPSTREPPSAPLVRYVVRLQHRYGVAGFQAGFDRADAYIPESAGNQYSVH